TILNVWPPTKLWVFSNPHLNLERRQFAIMRQPLHHVHASRLPLSGRGLHKMGIFGRRYGGAGGPGVPNAVEQREPSTIRWADQVLVVLVVMKRDEESNPMTGVHPIEDRLTFSRDLRHLFRIRNIPVSIQIVSIMIEAHPAFGHAIGIVERKNLQHSSAPTLLRFGGIRHGIAHESLARPRA